MKTISTLIKSLGRYLRLGVAAGTALLSCGLPLHAPAASDPVGTWDVAISGSRQGLAVMQFNDDGSFTMFEIIVPRKVSSSSHDTGDRSGPDNRNDEGLPPSTITFTNLFGEEAINNGRWSFDVNGRVVGTFGETLAEVCTPETFTVVTTSNFDNSTYFITNTVTITNCVGITNGVSFTGTAVPGKRLTLSGRAFGRPVVFSGLPLLVLTNASGDYNGARIVGGETSFEFLTLSVSSLDPLSNVIYDVHGASGGYSYTSPGGHALISRRGRVAFSIPFDPDGNIRRATVGGFDLRRLRFNTLGVEQPEGQFDKFTRFNGAVSTGP
jgi:hypothetical protein